MLNPLRAISIRRYFQNIFRTLNPVMWRNVVFIVGIVVFVLYNVFTFFATQRLRNERHIVTDAYVKLIENQLLFGNYQELSSPDLSDIVSKLTMPVIITDTLWNPLLWENISQHGILKNVEQMSDNLTIKQKDFLKNKVIQFKKEMKPYPLTLAGGSKKAGYLLIGKNRFFNMLSIMPYIEVPILVAFFIFTYVVFHNIRLTERSNLWVGLAKETAHQLGTPISSLMGWIEYMRTIHEAEPPIEPDQFVLQIGKICEDMEKDLKRLKIVTARFSQIGSIPTLSDFSVNESIKDIADYFQMRLPLLRKRIEIIFSFSELPLVNANKDLMEWVFENIMKNSIDAILRNDGLIEIKTEYIESIGIVRTQFIDNGKGISRDIQQQIFSPGFTTKKRGWGLGLTLAKRIVEEYHNGRIYVSRSKKDKGTIFCIDLPAVDAGQIV